MKCLTLKPRYARAVLAGIKRAEYRSFPTSHRGFLAIHSSRPDGFLLCVVTLVGCTRMSDGQYLWRIMKPVAVERVRISGKPGLWDVPDNLVKPIKPQ